MPVRQYCATTVNTDDVSSESVISRYRLQLSDMNPAMKIAIASAAVLTETASALTAGLKGKRTAEHIVYMHPTAGFSIAVEFDSLELCELDTTSVGPV